MLVASIWPLGRTARFSIEVSLTTCVAADCRASMAAPEARDTSKGKLPRRDASRNIMNRTVESYRGRLSMAL